MQTMYYMVTVTKREYCEDFLQYFYDNGVHAVTCTLCEGTAQQWTLDLLGIEKTAKVMLTCVVSGALSAKLLRGLLRTMQIDVPGNGIAFLVPLQSVASSDSLQYLTQGQKTEQEQVIDVEENRFSLVVVIAKRGFTGLVMDAARSAGAGGGTIIHAKGIGSKNTAQFFGMSLASEQELIYIISKRKDEKNILRAMMEKAATQDDPIDAAFTLPVSNVIGLRSVTDDEPAEENA